MPCLGNNKKTTGGGGGGGGQHHNTPSKPTDDHDRSSTAPDHSDAYRSAMVRLLSSLYCLTVIILAFVLSTSAALQQFNANYDSIYLQSLQVYLYVTALLFLAYVHIYMLRHRAQGHVTADEMTSERTLEKKVSSDGADEGLNDGVQCEVIKEIIQRELPETLPSGVTFTGQDVNFYLRLGAIVYGIGTMVQDGFHLSQLLQDGQLSFRCVPPFNILVIALHMVFTFIQTYYIFKSHRIVAHRQKCIVRFGFLHLVATNISVWICAAVAEIHTDFQVNNSVPPPDGAGSSIRVGVLNSTTVMPATAIMSLVCDRALTLSRQASPYLYPCTVQYSLLVAAVVCQMYHNIGLHSLGFISQHIVKTSSEHDISPTGHETTRMPSVDCDKAHRGLFLGLFVLVLTLVAISCYFVIGHNAFNSAGTLNHELYAGFIYYTMVLVLLVVSSAAALIAAGKFRQLRFIPPTDVDVSVSILLETALLIAALMAVTLLECFRAVSAMSAVNLSTLQSTSTLVSILSAVTSACVFVQTALQTVYIIDAMRRVVRTPGQQRRKPGRTLVTFLLLANVSLFLVTIFDVNRPENMSIHGAVYGPVAWSVITHATFPLTIFYRFHSVVCLSSIWTTAYTPSDK